MILFLLGSRGEWGYIRPVIDHLRNNGEHYSICATNMVLLPDYGELVRDIESDGYVVSDKVLMSLDGDSRPAMAKSLGVFLTSFIDVLERLKPEWLVLAGDRGEQLMGAVAGAFTHTPTAHIQAGERSGNIDGLSRHAIARFAHIHFAANEDAATRLIGQGEDPRRVHNVGAPQLDEIRALEIPPISDLTSELRVEMPESFLLVVNHANTEEWEFAERQASSLIEALNDFDIPKIVILPNNDAGSQAVRSLIMSERKSDWLVFSNLSRRTYLGLMARAQAMVGNSSSGLLEAPSFSLPAVNIGTRQNDRVRGRNVIQADYEAGSIRSAIKLALSDKFRDSLQGEVNPYGDGKSAPRIFEALQSLGKWEGLLKKNVTF